MHGHTRSRGSPFAPQIQLPGEVMKKCSTVLLTLTALATMGSSAVQAQVSNPWKFTIFAGAALPSGNSSDDLKTGYTVGGAVDLRAPLMPAGLRRVGLLELRREEHERRRKREPE
jgi:hypothetical protein